MKFSPLFILIIFLITSCHKDRLPFQSRSISDLTGNLTGEIKQRTQLRLSFAKAVANALEDVEFRDYIYRISKENTKSFFNEIVFAIHKDDIVVGNKSLATVIKEAADKEITDLYGSDFINKVLEEDPLVAIKIPDIYYKFNWDIESYAPMVGVWTPIYIDSETKSFVGYHYSGFMDYLHTNEIINYFLIVVKYSEDYIMFNPSTWMNEKNISIFELIPQLDNCSDTIFKYIDKIGLNNPKLNDFIYIKKRLIADYFINKCESDYVYFGEMAMQNCEEECVRDCIKNVDEINDVFEKVTILNENLLGFSTLELFEDNLEVLFFFFIPPNDSIIDIYKIIGFRKNEYFDYNVSYTEELVEQRYESIGKVRVPKVYVKKKIGKNKDIYINHRFRKGWGNEDSNSFIMHNFLIVRYHDIVKSIPLIYSYMKAPPLVLNCSDLIEIDQSPLDYCMPPQLDDYYNIVMVSVKHRY